MSYYEQVKVEPGSQPIAVSIDPADSIIVEPGVNPLPVSIDPADSIKVEPGASPINVVASSTTSSIKVEAGTTPIPVLIESANDAIKVEPGASPLSIASSSANPIIVEINPNSGGRDSFQRLRVSEPATLFDGKTLNDAAPLKFDDAVISGSGTSTTFNTNQASVTLAVSNTTAGRRARQSFQRFNYMPGKSHLILMTFLFGAKNSGIKKSIGYFSDRNGIFLNWDGTNLRIVRRTYTSGSAVDNPINQASWNLDTMDGLGPSGLTLDLTKTQILVIDLEWLGVGRVRIGFNINGQTHYVHEMLNANALTTVYMSSPNLPIRYEIENTGAGPADSITAICATVISEGGQDPIGQPFGVASSAIKTTINGTGATRYGLIGMRLKSSFIDQAVVVPTLITMIGTTANDSFAWELVLNPTVAGSPTWTGITNSAMELVDGRSANTVTGGTILMNGVALSQSSGVQLSSLDNLQPGANIAGTPQEIYLVIRPFANMSAIAAVSWRELA